ncbi:c-type cytochrome [Dyadobacter psychrotolerans]|uniref:C-type cytochrome n=1 Tax=Dyadobacter psychrotolerans TaxID=2541721 RepID=A0A4R5DK30_9BACT|nr:c-type cytochrome [Dyadobacter psychrotolerans]TDE12331.1 c-type cytochrome [Dyadobacter psychrotolerans]
MLTIALDTSCYIAYDLQGCTLRKVWKGGISMDGAPFTGKKDVQPTSWGANYFSDSTKTYKWTAEQNGRNIFIKIFNRGYYFDKNQIYLKYALTLTSGDTILIEERPEFVPDKKGNPGLERVFKTSQVPHGVTISLRSSENSIALGANTITKHLTSYQPLPEQFPPVFRKIYAHIGQELMDKSDCFTCHELDKNAVGPAFQQVAKRYQNDKNAVYYLTKKIREGGSGTWGNGVMNPHPLLSDDELKTITTYVLTLTPKTPVKVAAVQKKDESPQRTTKPGYGAALTGVHPAFDLTTLHNDQFQPKVGGLAFLPDGRLLLTTWDQVGGVYIVDGLEKSSKIKVKRIATGLAEPLGIEVVDGEIYVLQKQELTHLIDRDGDEIIDEYKSVCNTWTVSADFHEFAFGLVYKDGYFYVTLSMAMRLKPGEKQLTDRGKTLKVSRSGTFEIVNYGLRTPNGIGLGPDNEIFLTDNQGQWLPANKLIHIKQGEYLGMGWDVTDPKQRPAMSPPAIWLPENEIGNSPSEPVLLKEGLYKGQLLHGDVTYGGIQRDFLEKVKGEYQGAVFRFSQGLEAGVNRMRFGPDGALYVGEVGMVGGGWSWNEKLFGLQKLKSNGKTAFEMLAVRAKRNGFEIEFTQPLQAGYKVPEGEFTIQQWWYLPTEKYGGPKMDQETLSISKMTISNDRKKLLLELPNLKKGRVVYFRLPDNMQSQSGQSLWSSETWYTLNQIPD